MEGTNVEKGKQMLKDSGLNFTTADTMNEAAEQGRRSGGTDYDSWQSLHRQESHALIVQGLTGREGTFHAKQAAAYGTQVVGGVTPGKGGTTHEGWPVFNTVRGRRARDRRQRDGRSSCRLPAPPTPSSKRWMPGFRWPSASPRAFRRST